MTYWTLATGGTEQTLEAWGVLVDFSISLQSKGKSVATLTTTEKFDPAVANWSFKQHAIIYRDRTSPNGLAPFASGVPVFQGYFDAPAQQAQQGGQHLVYKLNSVWWLLERNMFKQYRMQFQGFSKNLQRVVSAIVVNGGAGYKSGDVIQANGGLGTLATFNVLATGVNGTLILAVTNNAGGTYSTIPQPTTNVATTRITGVGGGATLNLTFSPAPILSKVVSSEVWLGEDLHADGGYVSLWPNGNGDQIGEVLDWMNLTYNPTRNPNFNGNVDVTKDVVQKGIIDPHTQMPVTRVNTVFCAEAINSCLRWDPDTVISEDPTTNPPTLHIRKLGRWNRATNPPTFLDYTNLPEIPLIITAQQEKEILLQSQQSRQVPGVIIYYKENSTVDGTMVEQILIDKYPPGIDDWTPEVSSHTVVLQGSSLTHAQAQVNINLTFPLSLLTGGVAASQSAWWTGHDTTLTDPAVDQSSIAISGEYTATDMSGNPIDLTQFTAELLDNTLPSWAPVSRLKVKVSQLVTMTRYKDATHKVLDVAKTAMHTKTILVTNATQQLYTAVGSFATGESAPVGVAESVYRSLANADSGGNPVPLFSGRVTFLSQPLLSPTDAMGVVYSNWIGTRLKLIGPHNVFQNLMVQSVNLVPARGETTLEFGPGPAVDIDVWIELARATRMRMTWGVLPSNRGDGGLSGNGGATIDTGSAAPADDTSHGAGGHSFDSVSA